MIQEILRNSTPTLIELIPGKAKDIAEKFCLDVQSVRRILNGKEGYNEQTVQKVLNEAVSILAQQPAYYEQQHEKWNKIIQQTNLTEVQ